MAAGKVEIGAFRTYPPNYKPPDAVTSEYQSIPLDKIEDFGVHANQYVAHVHANQYGVHANQYVAHATYLIV